VRTLEQKLESLKYYVGTVDSSYDEDTAQAVTAFQKVEGMTRTGEVNGDVWNRINSAQSPKPLVPRGGERRVEIDIARQVLFLYEGNNLSSILAVSTGSQEPYCENGSCGDAVTPTGDFRIYRIGSGWESGPLGDLYNPHYFVGGVAIHGARSVPTHPASHGCVRITMSAAEWFPSRVSNGTPVYVR
jgi:lipoprotein-anchoring transpeptidase ErfK/SrfK